MKRIVFLTLTLAALSAGLVRGQSSTVSSGGTASGTGGSAGYTAGQVAYTVLTGADGTAVQGVQQPFEISVTTDAGFPEITLEWKVYPNPVNDRLTLKAEGSFREDLTYLVTDMTGKTCRTDRIVSEETQILFTDMKPGTYLLRLSLRGIEIKVFKVIKH